MKQENPHEFIIVNTRSAEIRFQIEPSGNYCPMPLGAEFHIRLIGGNVRRKDMFLVEDDGITLSLESGAYIKVLHDGEILMDE